MEDSIQDTGGEKVKATCRPGYFGKQCNKTVANNRNKTEKLSVGHSVVTAMLSLNKEAISDAAPTRNREFFYVAFGHSHYG
jgi:hypothetical protein